MEQLRLTKVGEDCFNNDCPTAYVTNRDTIGIQGDDITAALGRAIPNHEGIVEIPLSLMPHILKAARLAGWESGDAA